MKLAFASIVIFLQLFAVSWAFSISKGSIKSNGESVAFGEMNTQEIKNYPSIHQRIRLTSA